MESETAPAFPTLPGDRFVGLLLIAIMALHILSEWLGAPLFAGISGLLVIPLLTLLAPRVGRARRIFLVVGVALAIATLFSGPDWSDRISSALQSAAFIAAFFTALASLRNASQSSPAIEECGHFLARQPPGRRYLALTIGGHAFALPLNYGALVLLGSFAEASARREGNAVIRSHRIRRMLLAIQRGFVSSLPWSPLGFAIALSTTLVPGATWSAAVPACLVSSLILTATGWGLDSIFKPRLSPATVQQTSPAGDWSSVLPLVGLLAVLAIVIGGFHLITGIRAVGVVMLMVPIVSAAWIAVQDSPFAIAGLRRHLQKFISADLPGYQSELVLLMMAGFIGTLGAGLLRPVIADSGLDLSTFSAGTILTALVWVIPLAGQLGMNPIMSVSLIAPLVPRAAEMGVDPADIVVAVTAGWALAGASSPYTATTALIGAMGNVSALHVGIVWNGAYTLVCAVLLSLWIAAMVAM